MTLKYGMSLREFTSLKENVKILELLDAANEVDEMKMRRDLEDK